MAPNVRGVAGSLRHDSRNRRLLGALEEWAGDDLRLTVYDGLEQIPLFNEDAEEPTPPGVRQLREAVRGADGLLIATPEYNKSMRGALKNAIDWLYRPELVHEAKTVSDIGANGWSWETL